MSAVVTITKTSKGWLVVAKDVEQVEVEPNGEISVTVNPDENESHPLDVTLAQ